MVLRALPAPFFGWLGTLLFLLLMQFLIKFLPDIAGRGLPLSLIVELIAYNLAYMVVLAVPMSALLASLMAFGALAESRAYVVIKSSGVSLMQLLWPALLFGGALTACMTYFNNVLLPESNFRARNTWNDVRNKRPDFELQPGVFYGGLSDYSILVRERIEDTGELRDILIYDYTRGSRNGATIKAQSGMLEPAGMSVDLVLRNGEIHRLLPRATSSERYERLSFESYRLRLNLSEFTFERSDPTEGYRSDRSTRTSDMIHLVDSLESSIAELRMQVRGAIPTVADRQAEGVVRYLDTLAVSRMALSGLSKQEAIRVYAHASENARTARSRADELRRNVEREELLAKRYRVEIHKKYSIALACLIFVLIGAPLGLSTRRGGLGAAGVVALGVFMFYWVTLVHGEKMSDRNFLEPWIGMWIANIIIAIVGLWLILYVAIDLRATPPLRKRL